MNKFSLLLILAALTAGESGALGAPDPKDIMRKNEDARKVSDIVSTAVLKTGGKGQVERTKGFTWSRKLLGDNVH